MILFVFNLKIGQKLKIELEFGLFKVRAILNSLKILEIFQFLS